MTTEDNKDQGAGEADEVDEGVYVAVCGALVEVGVNPDDAEEDTPWFLSALAEAGYTVVKTESPGVRFAQAVDALPPEEPFDWTGVLEGDEK